MANPNHHHQGHQNPIQPGAVSLEDDTFKRVAETREQVNQVAASAREAIQAFYTDPQGLVELIERYETPVYVLRAGPFSNVILKILGFEPGFILPEATPRFTWLQRVLSVQDRFFSGRKGRHPNGTVSFSNGVFVIPDALLTMGFLSHQLHHWLSFRSGMDGYCERARRLYKKFWAENQGQIGREVFKMDAADIMALKAAINRDLEALKFLKAIADEVLIPARQARRIGHGTASA
ncbi:hypothetical protein [Vampirovibrio sp.]|uniref:hypothetical protein n=1 Tax=Vampirovibrio sp. TaxID=2717857 RepID=UPI0035932235